MHYLHHKNINPISWSGMAMHPVETFLYFSVVLIHWIVPSHPFHFLFNLQHTGLSPACGHHGFEGPIIEEKWLTDSYFHYLHHRYFECNYGEAGIPLDKWFGTFRDGQAAGLFLLEMLALEKVSVNQIYARLEKEFGPHRYARLDVPYPLEKRAALMTFLQAHPPEKLVRSPLAKVEARDGVKFVADDSTWLMLRGSGTEPVLRIYAEAGSAEDVQKLLDLGVSWLRPR